jgi:hypothetical protein
MCTAGLDIVEPHQLVSGCALPSLMSRISEELIRSWTY